MRLASPLSNTTHYREVGDKWCYCPPEATTAKAASSPLHRCDEEPIHASALRQSVQRRTRQVEAKLLAEEANLLRVLLLQCAACRIHNLAAIVQVLQGHLKYLPLLRNPEPQPVVGVGPLHVRVPAQRARLGAGRVNEHPVHLPPQLREERVAGWQQSVVLHARLPHSLPAFKQLQVPVVMQVHMASVEHRWREAEGLTATSSAIVEDVLAGLGVHLLCNQVGGLVLDLHIAKLVLRHF
mmetsp:Transcript_12582/g.14252  ORF Transcript_12582/g.14252 Transcript_12582/m.14252 type:complete len:239 (+) Transcript_12582:3-719(+)